MSRNTCNCCRECMKKCIEYNSPVQMVRAAPARRRAAGPQINTSHSEAVAPTVRDASRRSSTFLGAGADVRYCPAAGADAWPSHPPERPERAQLPTVCAAASTCSCVASQASSPGRFSVTCEVLITWLAGASSQLSVPPSPSPRYRTPSVQAAEAACATRTGGVDQQCGRRWQVGRRRTRHPRWPGAHRSVALPSPRWLR